MHTSVLFVAAGCTVLVIGATSTAVARPIPVESSESTAGPVAFGHHFAASPWGTTGAVVVGADGSLTNQRGVLVNSAAVVVPYVNPSYDLGGFFVDPNDRDS
jgi:hypothetical protein